MWEELSKVQKFLFIVCLCLIVPFAPEFIFMADIGGIELVFSFLALYYRPLILRLRTIASRIKLEVSICITAFRSSAVLQPKVYLTQTLFYSCAFIFSGSLFYASIFFLPAFILNGALL